MQVINRMAESKNEMIKRKTLELYDSLPQELEERKKRTDIRDQIIELNYTFFGYVATHTYVSNPSVEYMDKFNSAVCAFLDMWWKYKYAAKYRTDLSFVVFFKPRLSECVRRELNNVSYSVRRTLCMKVGDQLGKHWAKVTAEDIDNPDLKLSHNELDSLKAIFNTQYLTDIKEIENIKASDYIDIFEDPTDNYDSIHDFLINEMIYRESKLSDKDLLQIADMYSVDFWEIKKELPKAEKDLYIQLKTDIDISDNLSDIW